MDQERERKQEGGVSKSKRGSSPSSQGPRVLWCLQPCSLMWTALRPSNISPVGFNLVWIGFLSLVTKVPLTKSAPMHACCFFCRGLYLCNSTTFHPEANKSPGSPLAPSPSFLRASRHKALWRVQCTWPWGWETGEGQPALRPYPWTLVQDSILGEEETPFSNCTVALYRL